MAVNEPVAASQCLYTTVRNLLTRTAYFDFLPPHGRRLACGEEITVWGDIQHHFTRQTTNDRSQRALELCLANKQIAIEKTPAVHLYDATLDNTKVLSLDSGSFAVVDPCWGAYASTTLDCD
jgi:hypothetical protein